MKVEVLLFASVREAVGQRRLTVMTPDGATVEDLLQRLVSDYPKLAGHTGTLMAAVNQEYVQRDTVLHDDDEVAFIPPVSGGSDAL